MPTVAKSPWLRGKDREAAEAEFWRIMEAHPGKHARSVRDRVTILSVRRVAQCLTMWVVTYEHRARLVTSKAVQIGEQQIQPIAEVET